MPRDARLGFVVGVTLVILVAVIFYHGDGKAGPPGNLGTVGAKEAAKGEGAKSTTPVPKPPIKAKIRTHVVKEGESLTSIAVKYYDDGSKHDLLYRANKSQLRSPAEVPVGTVLVIPDLSAEGKAR